MQKKQDETASSLADAVLVDLRKSELLKEAMTDAGFERAKAIVADAGTPFVGDQRSAHTPLRSYHNPVMDVAIDQPVYSTARADKVSRIKEADVKTRRIGPTSDAAEEDKRPKCQSCGARMVYIAAEDRMKCECGMVAIRRRTFFDQMKNELGHEFPVYRGSLAFVTDEEGELFLHLEGVGLVSLAMLTTKLFEGQTTPDKYPLAFVNYVEGAKTQLGADAAYLKRQREEQELYKKYETIKLGHVDPNVVATMFGIALPPHIKNSPEAMEAILGYFNNPRSSVLGLPHADRVAAAIARLHEFNATPGIANFPTAFNRQHEMFPIYDRDGNLRDSEEAIIGQNPAIVLRRICDILRDLDRKTFHLDRKTSPGHYVMVKGQAYTLDELYKLMKTHVHGKQRVVTSLFPDDVDLDF